MAYNVLSGTVLAANVYKPSDIIVSNIVSGNLSTSDGASIINIPRVSNATNDSVITNVSGDANTLVCESNLKFDGSVLTVTGDLTASIGVSASFFEGDGSRLTGITGGGGGISWDGSTAYGVATFKDSDEATVNANFTFNGSAANITGDLTASIGVSASFFEGDGSRLKGIAGGAIDVEQYGAAPLGTTISSSADFALIKSGAALPGTGGSTYTLPGASAGKVLYVKLSASVANVTVTAASGDRIEGGSLAGNIILESTGSAVTLIAYNGSDWWIV